MNDVPTSVLLVEDDPADARLIQEALADTGGGPFRVEWVTRLSAALERLHGEGIDVVLLDLTLPDGQGLEAFDQVFQAAPNALILVMTGATDAETARQAIQRGAHDHLAKGHVDAHWLPRALSYVTGRKSAELVLRAAEEALFEEKERAQVTLNSIGDAVLTTDLLGNVTYLNLVADRLARAIGLAQRHRKQVALLFLDLDHFKHINDSLGHAIGDQVLQAVAKRLAACVRATDTVCRQGGDEFVILLAEIEQPQDTANVAEKLLAALAAPLLIADHELHLTLSIGISVYPDDGVKLDTVMQNADTAMYHAKASGRNNYQFFRPLMNTRAVRRLFVESSLRRALKQDEFVLHYQPQIDLDSGAMTGSEALVRWQDPELGLIAPGQFVPIAEECGLIVPIGRWVLREACRQVRAWLDSGLRAVPVAVNISAVEFRHKDFLEGVAQILKESGLAPRYLELEVTESVLMHDAESSASVLEALKAMGVQLAIDDFGTGYSSLSYLKRFPIDTLKIDQSFVRHIATNADDATIVGAVIGMGRNLNQRVIAEGVESHDQLAFLRTRQCAEGQGFHFSHPLPADDFARLLIAEDDEPARRRLG